MSDKTPAQRNAEHLWFRQVAQLLADNSIDQRVVIERLCDRGIDIPWSDTSFKENVYKPILKRVSGATSTEKESTTDPQIIYMGLCKWFAEEFQVTLPPWPSDEPPLYGDEND